MHDSKLPSSQGLGVSCHAGVHSWIYCWGPATTTLIIIAVVVTSVVVVGGGSSSSSGNVYIAFLTVPIFLQPLLIQLLCILSVPIPLNPQLHHLP